jgi:thioredoxin reductase
MSTRILLESSDTTHEGHRLPVAVIGAGPIGLVAGAHLVSKGETPLIFEAGPVVGASIRQWAHVRLFSPWKYLIDSVARTTLETKGWLAPDPDRLPTGGELIAEFLEPLAAHPGIAPHLRLGHRVVAVTRRGMDKVKTAGRDTTPFELMVRRPDGRVMRVLARAVIDASGTWESPNPMGAGGVAASGEAEHGDRIQYGIPDVLGRDRVRYAGRRTLVVGSGHSAFNTVLDLVALSQQAPGTDVVWAVRRSEIGLLFGGGAKDALEARGALGTLLRRVVATKQVRFLTGFRIGHISNGDDRLTVQAEDGRRVTRLDQLSVTTGFRPDLGLTRELRLKLDPWLEAPERLAPLIDPNLHSCGTVYPHGATELAHPERDFYVVGMKSYGRAPTFLLLTGYEQVRSVVCALVGDEEGARNVELVLPETGVCQTDLGGGSCCGASDLVEESQPVALVAGTRADRAPTSGGCGCGTAPSRERGLPTVGTACCG